MKINILAFFFLITLVSACTEEVVNTLTYPTTFTFNTPVLESRSVHRIDSFYTGTGADKVLNWKFTPITENLGKFDRSNSVISDTLNQIMRDSFARRMITSITLLSSEDFKISTGFLDTLGSAGDPSKFKIKTTGESFFKKDPRFPGNFLRQGMYLNNDSREIYICNEFIYASKSKSSGREYSYTPNGCQSFTPQSSLLDFVRNQYVIENGFPKYDTASVEYVNFIFSSYK
jgi:hypothetical protein